MEDGRLTLRSRTALLSEDECSFDQSERGDNSPSDSAFHSDFSPLSFHDSRSSLSANIFTPLSRRKTLTSWTYDRLTPQPALTTASLRLSGTNQKLTFYSGREQSKNRPDCNPYADASVLEGEENEQLENQEIIIDSGNCRDQSFDRTRSPLWSEGQLDSPAPSDDSLDFVKGRCRTIDVDDTSEIDGIKESWSHESCEDLTLFGDDDSVASDLLWSPSSQDPPPPRPDFVPKLDLTWVLEDENVNQRRSKKMKTNAVKVGGKVGKISDKEIAIRSQMPEWNLKESAEREKFLAFSSEINCESHMDNSNALNIQTLCTHEDAFENEACCHDFTKGIAVQSRREKIIVAVDSSDPTTMTEPSNGTAIRLSRVRSLETHDASDTDQVYHLSRSALELPPSEYFPQSSLSDVAQLLPLRRNCKSDSRFQTSWGASTTVTSFNAHRKANALQDDEIRHHPHTESLPCRGDTDSIIPSRPSPQNNRISSHSRFTSNSKPSMFYYINETTPQTNLRFAGNESHDGVGPKTRSEHPGLSVEFSQESSDRVYHRHNLYDVEAAGISGRPQRRHNRAKQFFCCYVSCHFGRFQKSYHCNSSCFRCN